MIPSLIDFHGYSLATYGVLVAIAYLVGIYWLKSRLVPGRLSESTFWSGIYWLFFGAIGGGKLLYVLLELPRFLSGEIHLVRDFRFGFVFYGGLIGAVAMGAAFCAIKKVEFWGNSDYFGVALPIGHAIGRLGCLAAGCCYGRPTAGSWGVRFTHPDSLVPDALRGVPLHPAQLYESLGDLAIAAFLYGVVLKRVERKVLRPGTTFIAYGFLYAVLRFVVEIFRGDDRGGFLVGLSPSQVVAVAALIGTSMLLVKRGLWNKNSA
ncbi:MAG: prolipoprotein diacylglyceryl transferase [Elusimicrobia bacterium]|nr:prolipoprotein diacylglyceryl transferase [Elusimicrobiota bacterium]